MDPAPVPVPQPVQEITFTDTKGHWGESYIVRAAELGLFKGYPDGSFRPDKGLTRAEAAAVCVRLRSRLDGEALQTFESTQASAPSAEELMDPGARALAKEVLQSIKITGSEGGESFSCSQPEIPEAYHLKISLEIFAQNSEGTPGVFRYVSDEGYLSDPGKYDPSAHSTKLDLSSAGRLDGKAVFLEILIINSTTREMASYYLKQDFDGDRSLTAVYDPPEGSAALRVIDIEEAEGYFD